jgi:hypothetical protein
VVGVTAADGSTSSAPVRLSVLELSTIGKAHELAARDVTEFSRGSHNGCGVGASGTSGSFVSGSF